MDLGLCELADNSCATLKSNQMITLLCMSHLSHKEEIMPNDRMNMEK
mgnify:FL=1